MKKTALIIIVALLVGAGATGVYFYTHGTKESSQPVVQVAEKAKEVQKTKYEVGPPDATEILELVNNERAKIGVKPLVIDENVQKSAQLKADDMAANNYFAHIMPSTGKVLNPEMDKLLSASCSSSSENIAKTYEKNANSQATVNQWMNSKPHHDALLDTSYTKTGIAVVHDEDQQNYTVVQHFCRP